DAPAGATAGTVLDVAVVRWPRVANFGDLDPLRAEPGVAVRWIRSPAELGRPQLVVLPGSKATRDDLAWMRASGLDAAVAASGAAVVAICAGAQAVGDRIEDPDGVEGPPGVAEGLGWLPLRTTFAADKVLDRPRARAVAGPGAGAPVTTGYRIHHGRVRGDADPWLVDDGGTPVGWHGGRVCATTLHGLFESDELRAGVLAWAAGQAGWPAPELSGLRWAEVRGARFDAIADLLEAHLDLDRVVDLIEQGAPRAAAV
ncbi:MAG: cobyric acid synthase CobQ, partial [Acidimicrobiia bacterium]